MSSVFKSPKVKYVEPETPEPMLADDNQIVYEMEKNRKKKYGAVAQLLYDENGYTLGYGDGKKKKLGE